VEERMRTWEQALRNVVEVPTVGSVWGEKAQKERKKHRQNAVEMWREIQLGCVWVDCSSTKKWERFDNDHCLMAGTAKLAKDAVPAARERTVVMVHFLQA